MKEFLKLSFVGLFVATSALGYVRPNSALAQNKQTSKVTTAALPKILQEIETKYSKAGSIEAQFDQTTESATLQRKKHSSGTIVIKTPNKIRWETKTPDKNLLISDGNKFWFYTPPFAEGENGQLIERKGSDVRSGLASTLMTGSFTAAQRKNKMKIIEKSPSEFTLIPKKGSAGTVDQASIYVDLNEKLITRVKLIHADGNIADISLSKIELGKPTEDNIFSFSPPPHTEIIEE